MERVARREYVIVYLKGMMMGAADVVPGVSGGTIALITGVYTRLINALGKVGPQLWLTLRAQGWRAAWRELDGAFLFSLAAGILTSVLTLAGVLKYLLTSQPIPTAGFFFGLVAASVVMLLAAVKKWTPLRVLLFLLGVVIAVLIALAPVLHGAHGAVFLFFAGALAICAMILPGISGAFILLLLGAYETVLGAVHHFDLGILAVVAAGAVCGLLAFTHVLKWLFARYYMGMMAFLTGIVLGSLYKLWPWQLPQHVWPWAEAAQQVPLALLCMVLGAGLVWGINRVVKPY